MIEIPSNLIKKIKQKNFVVFVGAGMSIKSGLPNWNFLVEKILEGIVDKDDKSEKYKNALKDDLFTPIEVLQKISHLKNDAIDIFYNELNKYNQCLPTELHKKILKLSNKIITTNYDNLLELTDSSFEKVTYHNIYKVAKLSDFEKYIFKIHGDIAEPDKCILFPEDYEKLYSLGDKSSTFEIKKIISDKSIIFIGFSLNDPYINYIFNYINSLYGGFNPEHFIITTQKNQSWPDKITPILLNDYSELEEVLDNLIQIKLDQKTEYIEIQAEIETVTKSSIIELQQISDFDSPPSNKYWVGRQKEIINIGNNNFKIIFITGIGGQGKSALASHFLMNHFEQEKYEFADWRDFKEETNRFQTKLVSLTKRLIGSNNSNTLENYTNNELVDTFFYYLGNRKIIFVFDNVDSYIDLESFRPAGSLGYFFEQILIKDVNSKFIFTCRPFIREASVNFYQISLQGISELECEELFEFYKIPVSKVNLKNLSNRAHKIAKGHPLWLNLIAGQAIRGVETVTNFIDSIEDKSNFDEDNFSAILSEKILNEVWLSLNDKQKILLRGISETVKPEKEENLKSILDSELNNNQFSKSLRVLKNLNLIETLSDQEIELHPLVKEFILTKYPRTERAKFITLFVQYYDKFIYILKPKLNSNLTITEFQNWTLKIELQINKSDYKSALIVLEEVSTAILTAGFTEEYLRVSELLFKNIDWQQAITQEYPYFHSQFTVFTTAQIQLGKFELCSDNLEKYIKLIPGKSSFYLSYCSQKSYKLWFQGLFEDSIAISEEGVSLLDESTLPDNYSLRHNLALARRDSKNIPNLKKALEYFLRTEKIEDILNRNKINTDLNGHFYGNIGKCLSLMNQKQDALFCYYISLKLLFKENDTNSILNRGYAAFWISELLIENKQIKDGLHFLKFARICWDKTSPPRVKLLKNYWNSIKFDKTSKDAINAITNWKIENYCKDFLTANLQ